MKAQGNQLGMKAQGNQLGMKAPMNDDFRVHTGADLIKALVPIRDHKMKLGSQDTPSKLTMKISILFFLFSIGSTVALSEGDANREQSSLLRRRVLKSKECNYVCPDNSEKKPNQECYDTFDDCECLYGYIKDEEKEECVVDKNSCSEAAVQRLYDMQSRSYNWVYSIRNMPKEVRIDEIEKLSDYMTGIWSDYNVIKASCEGHEEFGHRHLGPLGDFFEGFAEGFVGVIEDVVDVAGDVVDRGCWLCWGRCQWRKCL